MTATIHNPTNFQPQDYEVVRYLDNHPPQYYFGMGMDLFEELTREWEREFTSVYGTPDFRMKIHRCVHCGNSNVRYIAACKHIPTGEIVTFGDICVNRLDLPNADAFKAAYIRDKAARERKKKELADAVEKVLNEHPDFKTAYNCFIDHGDTTHKRNSFAADIIAKLHQYGSLSDRQIECATNSIARDHEYEARRQAEENEEKGPAPSGRQEVTGQILSIKERDTFYGPTLKMLVKLTNNAKVWCTVPSNRTDKELNRGSNITFKATFNVSDDDPHFAFGSRPNLVSIN